MSGAVLSPPVPDGIAAAPVLTLPVDHDLAARFRSLGPRPVARMRDRVRCPFIGAHQHRLFLASRPEGLRHFADAHGWALEIKEVRNELGIADAAPRAPIAELWKDPEFRKRQAAAVRAKWKDPEFRKRNAAATRASTCGLVRNPALLDEIIRRATVLAGNSTEAK